MEVAAARRWVPATQLDARAVALMALFGVVFVGALTVSPLLQSSGTQSVVSDHSAAAQAGGGIAWAVVETIFAGSLLGGILLFRRAPRWLQATGREVAVVGFWVTVAFYTAFGINGFVGWLAIPLVAGVKVAFEQLDAYWLFNDVLALGLAIGVGAQVGLLFGPVVVGVGLVLLTVYDIWFADRESWMFTLASFTTRWKLPMLFVSPVRWRLEWDKLDAAEDGLDRGSFRFVIGTADLLLPAAFAVAIAASSPGLPVWGVIAGVVTACLRLSAKMEAGGGAGLPPITTGALGGWAVATAVVMLA